jgi:hypothetical protein
MKLTDLFIVVLLFVTYRKKKKERQNVYFDSNNNVINYDQFVNNQFNSKIPYVFENTYQLEKMISAMRSTINIYIYSPRHYFWKDENGNEIEYYKNRTIFIEKNRIILRELEQLFENNKDKWNLNNEIKYIFGNIIGLDEIINEIKEQLNILGYAERNNTWVHVGSEYFYYRKTVCNILLNELEQF